ncbi:tRNA (cytosine-5-)-methyltransferase [Lunasporangiospora selenospora]|uniref:tRNA (cytosine(38)-C(5))-methyltransferase n=1 Tax=Lunasporangiospora selenospora TaxID=979761 RepID=A0A9P6KEK8_9FUNG|nr:tRNA (cytosine-5-)-methyltransferase [Lunasporangiospora selenospora]
MENSASPHFRILEFYSGIGGMHYAFQGSGHQGEIVKAFDINTTANQVYAHNHGKDRLGQYTRTGNQEGSKDTRAKSFLHLMNLLPQLQEKDSAPDYILLENVKGFEESDSRDLLVETLTKTGYEYQEMLITPLQIEIPNSRMRYYCLARRTEKVGSFARPVTGTLIGYIPSDKDDETDFVDGRKQGDLSGLSTSAAAKKRRTSLTTSTVTKEDTDEDRKRVENEKPDEETILADPMLALKIAPLEGYLEFQDATDERMRRYAIPEKTLLKYGRLFDIVKTSTRRSCCFTKGYYHFVESTGSILQMENDLDTAAVFVEAEALKAKETTTEEEAETNNAKALKLLQTLNLRYFTENEVARLMGFPVVEGQFSFPEATTLKQRYRVLGNSINVKVVSRLVKYLLA